MAGHSRAARRAEAPKSKSTSLYLDENIPWQAHLIGLLEKASNARRGQFLLHDLLARGLRSVRQGEPTAWHALQELYGAPEADRSETPQTERTA